MAYAQRAFDRAQSEWDNRLPDEDDQPSLVEQIEDRAGQIERRLSAYPDLFADASGDQWGAIEEALTKMYQEHISCSGNGSESERGILDMFSLQIAPVIRELIEGRAAEELGKENPFARFCPLPKFPEVRHG